jgi:hypothetical protein
VSEAPHQLSCAVDGVIVHHQDFEVVVLLKRQQLLQQRLDVAPFVVRGQHDRNPQHHGLPKRKPAVQPPALKP